MTESVKSFPVSWRTDSPTRTSTTSYQRSGQATKLRRSMVSSIVGGRIAGRVSKLPYTVNGYQSLWFSYLRIFCGRWILCQCVRLYHFVYCISWLCVTSGIQWYISFKVKFHFLLTPMSIQCNFKVFHIFGSNDRICKTVPYVGNSVGKYIFSDVKLTTSLFKFQFVSSCSCVGIQI